MDFDKIPANSPQLYRPEAKIPRFLGGMRPKRLTAVLNTVKDKSPHEILLAVKEDIDRFVGQAPQFDDITMLCLEYTARMNEAAGTDETAL